MHRPSELCAFLREHGIRPRKSFSQNFLIDGNAVAKIVDEGSIEPGDVIVEIGPGPGALTQALLERGATVLAIEKDRELSSALERLQTPDKRLHSYCSDCMEFPIEHHLSQLLRDGQKAKVVASLPYQITTPIMVLLAPLHSLFSKVVVVIQDEVARRYAASPGSKEFGSITLFLQFYGEAHYAFPIKRRCFYPVPNVDSAVFTLLPHSPPLSEPEPFHEMVRCAFGQRRKMIRKSLGDQYGQDRTQEALKAAGIEPTTRPEQLSLEQFIELYDALNRHTSKE